ncbi:MAG: acyloxyacyl hydrolase [Acidobacteriaceae bacterium]|nr:acyloxyacyl hydrolase [Acidobacteriaceae bacterium]
MIRFDRFAGKFLVLCFLFSGFVALAQVAENPMGGNRTTLPLEFGVKAQGGLGTNDQTGFKFFMLGVHAGKVLTPNVGPGLLRGNFEYAVEVYPLWQSYTPRFQRSTCTLPACLVTGSAGGTFTGVSITPVLLRWNFATTGRVVPWIQGGGGVIWTNHKYPPIAGGPADNTSVWNFTPQFGVGARYFISPRRSIDFGANAVHISSASLGDKNPGINASVQFTIGYTWWKQ